MKTGNIYKIISDYDSSNYFFITTVQAIDELVDRYLECGENNRMYLLNLLDEYGIGYIISYPEDYNVVTDYAETEE